MLPSEAGFIEIDGDNKREKIFHLKQRDIIQNVDLNSAKNAIDLQLTTFGPYFANYSRNGRYLTHYFKIKTFMNWLTLTFLNCFVVC